MEKTINENWLQAALENFDTCVESGDYNGCLAVISDVRSNGFAAESRTLRELLRNVSLTKFAIKSTVAY